MRRRLFLLIFCTLMNIALQAATAIHDVSKLKKVTVDAVPHPTTVEELQGTLSAAKTPIAIAGGRFSQGMHIAYPDSTTIDITGLNRIIAFNKDEKTITVQSGITWRQVQEFIDPFNLSVAVMQSYNDFTVGGSLSVNVHGRDIRWGPLIQTVRAIKLLCADGSIVTADRQHNADLFKAAIGGYGAVGIILEATLSLTDNILLKREVKLLDIQDYPHYFFNTILTDPTAVLHNANWYPTAFKKVLSVTWHETDEHPTIHDRMQSRSSYYVTEMIKEQLVRWIAAVKKLRTFYEPEVLESHEVVFRNYEMSHTVNTLEPFFRVPTTSILQEYFIPLEQFNSFVHAFRTIAQQETINILNVSIRYVPADTESLLAYAPVDSFAFVCYINVFNTQKGQSRAERWTRKLVDAALACKGTYYLPYQPWPTVEQCRRAYPRLDDFCQIKKQYDPDTLFSNSFLHRYLSTSTPGCSNSFIVG